MVTAMDKQNPFKASILKYLNCSSMKKVSKSDGLVLLTEEMMDFVERPMEHIVMEGIADVESMDVEVKRESTDKKIILYTGTLRKIFGVMNLVNAFQLIEDADVELWICGSGDSKEEIEQAAKNGARLDGWDEYFNYRAWLDAFETCGIDPEFYTTRGYGEDELLPWDTIDVGVTKKFLKLERKRAYGGKITPDCRHGCAGCGASDLLQEVKCDA
jgi:glycosyltransferase involved in cell wall biosynthesis